MIGPTVDTTIIRKSASVGNFGTLNDSCEREGCFGMAKWSPMHERGLAER
jgi:hypothetical protein